MSQAFKYTLKSSIPLDITSIEPSGQVNTNTPVLTVTTAKGAENGIASCGYSLTPNLPLDEIPLFPKTNSTTHELQLGPLEARTYTYYVTCMDIAGNIVEQETTFEVTIDTILPFSHVSRGIFLTC